MTDKPDNEDSAAEHEFISKSDLISPAYSETGSILPVFLIVILLSGIATFVFWWRLNTLPQRVLDESVQLLEGEDHVQLRTNLTRLEGLPQYELHQKTLKGSLLVRERSYSEADPLLEHLPDDQEIRAVGLLHRGIANYERDRFEKAEQDFKEALKDDPDNVKTQEWLDKARLQNLPINQVNRAKTLIEAGGMNAARQILERLDRGENKPYAALLRGLLELQEKKYEDALASFEISGKSGFPELFEPSLLGTARTFDAQGESDRAYNAFMSAIQNNVDCMEAHKWMVLWYYDLGAAAQMNLHLQKVIELDPDDPRPQRMLAFSLFESKMFKEAISVYESVWKLEMSENLRNEIAIEWAEALVRENRFEHALVMLNLSELENLKTEKLILKRDTLRATCLASSGENEEAFAMLDKVLAVDPKSLDGLSQKGELLLATGDLPRAIETYQKAVDAHPYDLGVHFKLAQLYRRVKNDAMADKINARHDHLQKLIKSMTEMESVAASEVNNVDVRIKLGRTAYELGSPKTTMFWLKAAMGIDPTNQEVIRLLELLNTGQPLEPLEPEEDADEEDADEEDADEGKAEKKAADEEKNPESKGKSQKKDSDEGSDNSSDEGNDKGSEKETNADESKSAEAGKDAVQAK